MGGPVRPAPPASWPARTTGELPRRKRTTRTSDMSLGCSLWACAVADRNVKDGHAWRIGGDADVAWIADGTSPGRTITAAIPPVFDAYATSSCPEAMKIRKNMTGPCWRC